MLKKSSGGVSAFVRGAQRMAGSKAAANKGQKKGPPLAFISEVGQGGANG